VYAPGEDDLFWSASHEITVEQRARGELVADAHIVALMRRYGVRTIVTYDRDLRSFDGVRVRDPFV
jgi:predicted nucleic acid-binding protein